MDVVVIAIDFDQAIIGAEDSAYDISQRTVQRYDLRFIADLLLNTVFIEQIERLLVGGVLLAVNIALANIAVLVKAVHFAINFLKLQSIDGIVVLRADIVPQVGGAFLVGSLTFFVYIEPLTLGNGAGLTEMIYSSGNGEITRVRRIVVSHTVPSAVVGLNPFVLDQLSVYGVVRLAVHREQTRAHINFIAVRAYEPSVGDRIAVTRCGDVLAPIDDGAANLAGGSAGIACFGTGRRLVLDRTYGVDMAAVPSVVIGLAFGGGDHILRHLVHLGIHLRTFAGEGIGGAVKEGDEAAVDLHADVDRPELLHGLELRIGKGSRTLFCAALIGIAHLQFPSTNGQRHQHALAGIGIAAGARDGDRCDILVILNGIGRLKAGCHDHMIQLPTAHIVQVDIDRDRLDFLNVRRHNIGIPDRAEQDLVQRGIARYDLHGRLAGVCLHVDRADHGGVVALIVADGELDMMQAVGQNRVNNGEHAVLIGEGSLHAVDIGLSRGAVEAGIVILLHVVCDLCAEADRAVGDRLAVQRDGIGHRAGGIGHTAEYRSLAIGYRVGIVHGDIIDVHDITAVIGLVLVVIVVIGGAVTVRNIELNHIVVNQIQTLVTAQIN